MDYIIISDKEDFYNKVSLIFGVTHNYVEPKRKKTRWNNRKPGNGRFPGFGLVRLFGEQVHINIYNPRKLNIYVNTKEEALLILEELINDNRNN